MANDLLQGLQTGMNLARMKADLEQRQAETQMKRQQFEMAKTDKAANATLAFLKEQDPRAKRLRGKHLNALAGQLGYSMLSNKDITEAIASSDEANKAYANLFTFLNEAAADGTISVGDKTAVLQQLFSASGDVNTVLDQAPTIIKALQERSQAGIGEQFMAKQRFNVKKDFQGKFLKSGKDLAELSNAEEMIMGDARSIMQLKKLIARMADPRLSNLDAELVLESRSLLTKFENKLSELASGQPTERERTEVRDLATRVFKVMQEAYQISVGNYAASLGKEAFPGLSTDEILDRELDPGGIRKLKFRMPAPTQTATGISVAPTAITPTQIDLLKRKAKERLSQKKGK